MSKKYMPICGIILAVLMLNLASAGVGFKQYSEVLDLQNMTQTYGYMQYGSSFESYPTTLCLFAWGVCYTSFVDYSDYVPSGQPFQAYIQYGLQPIAEWNDENIDSKIDYCTILVKESHFKKQANGTISTNIYYTLNRTFDKNDIYTTKDQYRHFISLYRGDYAETYLRCHFTGSNITLEIPASFSYTAPTYNCLACQYYESYRESVDQYLGDAIGIYASAVFRNIKLFLMWNIQIGITIFHVLRIVVLVALMGAGVLGIYWLYLFVRSFARR